MGAWWGAGRSRYAREEWLRRRRIGMVRAGRCPGRSCYQSPHGVVCLGYNRGRAVAQSLHVVSWLPGSRGCFTARLFDYHVRRATEGLARFVGMERRLFFIMTLVRLLAVLCGAAHDRRRARVPHPWVDAREAVRRALSATTAAVTT